MAASQWCNFAYTVVGSEPTVGKAVSASPGSKVKTTYKLNTSTQLWDQNVYIDGKLASTVSTSKGQHGKIFYISLECASGGCGTAGAHSTFSISCRDKACNTDDIDSRLGERLDSTESGRYELQAQRQLAVWCDWWGYVYI